MKYNGENSVMGLTGLALEGAAAQYGILISTVSSSQHQVNGSDPGWNI